MSAGVKTEGVTGRCGGVSRPLRTSTISRARNLAEDLDRPGVAPEATSSSRHDAPRRVSAPDLVFSVTIPYGGTMVVPCAGLDAWKRHPTICAKWFRGSFLVVDDAVTFVVVEVHI